MKTKQITVIHGRASRTETRRTPNSRTERRQRNGQRNGPRPRLIPVTGNEIIERGIPGFSALKYKAKLTYYEPNVMLTSGAGTAATYVFSTNGLYDPDITSTGHQPMAFDQLMLSFEHYIVTRAVMTTSFRSFTPNYPVSVALSLNAGPTPTSDYIRLVENGNLVRTKLGAPNGDMSLQTLSLPVDVAKFGSIDDLLDNPDYKGTIAANPVEQSYFHVSVWNPIDLSTVGVNLEMYIEFEAWFTEPRKNSLSLSRTLSALLLQEERTKGECKR